MAALFDEAAVSVRSLVVSAGHAVSSAEDGSLLVPKAELVAVLQVLLQGRRLQVAAQLPLAETLVRELESFRARVVPAAALEAVGWRERENDDLVLAAAVAAWEGERNTEGPGEPLVWDERGAGPGVWRR